MTDTHMPGNPHYQNALDMGGDRGLAHAMLTLAFEQRTANLIACSQKVYIRDSPDAIRERLGETPVRVETPTPFPDRWKSVIKKALREKLVRWGTYDTGNPDRLAIDALLDLDEITDHIYAALEANGG